MLREIPVTLSAGRDLPLTETKKIVDGPALIVKQ